ncbi:hypothetical protein K491DRAFT_601558 [Lophiostoma macrostomum CBS 122681]|uniref:Uncharacterized protein n=1 Tax=Lophiostoma macrostomum CBS 122681 TaxID=1314788 RepID=A0A6A6T2U8_9PLEO|nr:hypothetical protein K491DRAFT_601558 [Lophiostoma macrostomum CBS 122681]
MCCIYYTLHVCDHWVAQPSPGNGPMVRICDVAEEQRLGIQCLQLEHRVTFRSQGLCDACLWKQVSK